MTRQNELAHSTDGKKVGYQGEEVWLFRRKRIKSRFDPVLNFCRKNKKGEPMVDPLPPLQPRLGLGSFYLNNFIDDHRQGCVPGHIGRRSKGVLNHEESDHKPQARLIKPQSAFQNTERRCD